MNTNFKERSKQIWESLTGDNSRENVSAIRREKLIVFTICIVLAFCLWMIVNLNREYNIDIKVPIELGNIETNQSLATALPKNVTASITGTGWNLISTYKDPPHVFVDVSGDEVNLFEQVRQQIGSASHLSVQKVNPLYLQVKLEDQESKKVPVKANVNVSFAKQYAFLDEAAVSPDSIVIRGAASRIASIDEWPTDSLSFKMVKNKIRQTVDLKKPSSLITLSQSSVKYQADVAQFTEGEVTVSVEARDFPVNNLITFSPAAVNVKYRIPLAQYTALNKKHPFAAYVTYSQIQQDTTGFVVPHLEKLPKNMRLKIKNMQPPEVAYFTIIGK